MSSDTVQAHAGQPLAQAGQPLAQANPFNPVPETEVPEETGVPMQPMERAILSALGVAPLVPLASHPVGHQQPQSSASPALAPSGAAAAELQAPSESQSGSSAHPAPAPAPSGAVVDQPLFLEPERGDGGQRWVDLNIASGEDIWGLFLSPSLNGVKLLLLFFLFVALLQCDTCSGGYLAKSVIHLLCTQHADFASAYPGQVRVFFGIF